MSIYLQQEVELLFTLKECRKKIIDLSEEINLANTRIRNIEEKIQSLDKHFYSKTLIGAGIGVMGGLLGSLIGAGIGWVLDVQDRDSKQTDKEQELSKLTDYLAKEKSIQVGLKEKLQGESDLKLKINQNIKELYNVWPSYPPDWEERSSHIKKKFKNTCQKCSYSPRFKKNGKFYKKSRLMDVHHIVHLKNGGSHVEQNLTLLCRKCHENLHGKTIPILKKYNYKNNSKIELFLISIANDHNVRIKYKDRYKILTDRVVKPERFLNAGEVFHINKDNVPTVVHQRYEYIECFCYLRQQKRIFRVSRIESIENCAT
jgi:5-methylcytosine-specific restriction endonuclease McrA